MLWYIRYLQAALRRRSRVTDETGADEQHERLRLLSAEAELKELELAREWRELIALPDFEKTLADLVVTTKTHILAIPSQLAPQLVGEDRLEIESRLENELKESLSTLRRTRTQLHGKSAPTGR